ncbi:MAG: hypothetical protein ACOX44_09895 [Limnochordia bacterium]|jgi:hypothetical protein
MKKITDRILLAAAACAISTFPSRMVLRLLHKLRVMNYNYSYDELGGRLFMVSRAVKTPLGRFSGFVVNQTNNLMFTTALTYLLSATGRDKAVLKGIGLSMTSWVLLNGLTAGTLLKNKSKEPTTPFIGLLVHTLTGALSGLVISTLGDESLFPDTKMNDNNDKLPIVAGMSQ